MVNMGDLGHSNRRSVKSEYQYWSPLRVHSNGRSVKSEYQYWNPLRVLDNTNCLLMQSTKTEKDPIRGNIVIGKGRVVGLSRKIVKLVKTNLFSPIDPNDPEYARLQHLFTLDEVFSNIQQVQEIQPHESQKKACSNIQPVQETQPQQSQKVNNNLHHSDTFYISNNEQSPVSESTTQFLPVRPSRTFAQFCKDTVRPMRTFAQFCEETGTALKRPVGSQFIGGYLDDTSHRSYNGAIFGCHHKSSGDQNLEMVAFVIPEMNVDTGLNESDNVIQLDDGFGDWIENQNEEMGVIVDDSQGKLQLAPIIPELLKAVVKNDTKLIIGEQWSNNFAQSYHILTPDVHGDALVRLKTIYIQSRVCAALNSKRKLAIVLGLDDHKLVRGIPLDRNAVEQANVGLICCLLRGFSPQMPPSIYDVTFHKINDEQDLYMIIISINLVSKRMHQLLNGKAFVFDEEHRVHLISWVEACAKFKQEASKKYNK